MNQFSGNTTLLPQVILFFFFFSFIFISWRLITLQYCRGFCHTLTRISHGFTYAPHPDPPSPFLPIPSLWVFPVHQPWALVSCIQPGLVICFILDSILAILSEHPTLTFSHRVPKSVLYICVSLSVLHIGLLLPSFKIPYIYVLVYCIGVYLSGLLHSV